MTVCIRNHDRGAARVQWAKIVCRPYGSSSSHDTTGTTQKKRVARSKPVTMSVSLLRGPEDIPALCEIGILSLRYGHFDETRSRGPRRRSRSVPLRSPYMRSRYPAYSCRFGNRKVFPEVDNRAPGSRIRRTLSARADQFT